MKNRLSDLNDHLFAAIERLGDENLTPAEIEKEATRADAIVKISDQIISGASLKIQAAKILADSGRDPSPLLIPVGEAKKPLLEVVKK